MESIWAAGPQVGSGARGPASKQGRVPGGSAPEDDLRAQVLVGRVIGAEVKLVAAADADFFHAVAVPVAYRDLVERGPVLEE